MCTALFAKKLVTVSAKAIQYGSSLSPSENASTAKIAASFLANSGRQVAGSSATMLDLTGRSRAESLLGCLVSLHFWHSFFPIAKASPTIGAKLGRLVYRPLIGITRPF